MAGSRNKYGINDAADCHRTFNGELYPAWMSYPSDDRISEYRKAGIRCRRLGAELFVHHDDREKAAEIDAKNDTRPNAGVKRRRVPPSDSDAVLGVARTERDMGQAKARGTREQRIAQAQERDAAMRAERERLDIEAKAREAQRVAAMTPEKRKQYQERKHRGYMARASMVGLLYAMAAARDRERNA